MDGASERNVIVSGRALSIASHTFSVKKSLSLRPAKISRMKMIIWTISQAAKRMEFGGGRGWFLKCALCQSGDRVENILARPRWCRLSLEAKESVNWLPAKLSVQLNRFPSVNVNPK